MLWKMMLGAGLLGGAVSAFAQTQQNEAMVEAVSLARFCGSHAAKMKDLPDRMAAEFSAEQRASLDGMKTQPEYIEASKKMDAELGTLPPEVADEICGKLAGAPVGGMFQFIQEEGVYNGMMSFYPVVVQRSAQEYKKLPLAAREEVAKRLADALAEPKADDIQRGRVSDAFRAIGTDAQLASGELAKIIRESARGLPGKSQTVVVDPPLRSGSAVSNSATVTLEDSGEVMKAAFAVIASTQPLPVNTLCELAGDGQEKVRAGAAQVFAGAKMSKQTTCAAVGKAKAP